MILNQQKKIRVPVRSLAAFLHRVQRELGLENAEVSIAFVSDAEIARWNRTYRRKDGPTDVLSFPAVTRRKGKKNLSAENKHRKSDRTAPQFLGDIAVAPETARRYLEKSKRTLQNELRILILHGVLHLMGYDHESDKGEMNRIEQKLRRRLGIA